MSLPHNTTPDNKAITNVHRANLQVVSLMAMLGGWALLVAYAVGYFLTNDPRFITLVVLEIIFSLALTIAWLFQKRGKHNLATGIIFTATFTTVFLFTLLVAGLALTLGILLAIIFSMIALQTLPARNAIIATILSTLAGAFIVFTDLYLAQGDRIVGGFSLSALLVIVGGIIVFILVINGLRGIEFQSINSQLRTSFLVVSLIPVFIVALFQTATLANVLTSQASNNLLTNANTLANNLDTQLFTFISQIEEDTARDNVVEFFQSRNEDLLSLSLLASRYPNVISYGLLDREGQLILDNRGETGEDESEKPHFINAVNFRITYISDVFFDEDTGKGVFFISRPVLDGQGNLLGIIRVKISAIVLQKLAEDANRRFGEGINVTILDDANIILANSTNPELTTKTLSAPDRADENALQQAGRLPPSGAVSANLDELNNNLKKFPAGTVFTSLVSPTNSEQYYITVAPIKYKDWKVILTQQTNVFLSPAINQIISTSLIVLVLFAAIYFGANLTATQLVTPIKALASVAKEIGDGKLDVPIQLPRKDELGTLATALDNSRQQINDLLQTLEQRVEERTGELTLANKRNERRAIQLETISQIARAVTSLRNPNELLPEITQQISESFGYYHVGIFLLDEKREYAVLRAANSKGGQAMLARGHRLKIGRQGIVGNVTNTGRYRIALDVGDDAVFFNNPDLPETRSEAALPLLIGDNIIGALDVQSTQPNAFSEDDLKSLSLLSDQISVAIENARLFDETRQALAQIQEIYTESSASGWQSMVRDSNNIGFRYTKGSVEPLPIKTVALSTPAVETLEIPIVLRGEKLGVLKIRHPGKQTAWNETETRMYQAIAERMSFALENARLFMDARRRANLERVTAEAATKISASVRFETILRTAAEEISHLMDGSEVLIQIQPGSIEQLDSK